MSNRASRYPSALSIFVFCILLILLSACGTPSGSASSNHQGNITHDDGNASAVSPTASATSQPTPTSTAFSEASHAPIVPPIPCDSQCQWKLVDSPSPGSQTNILSGVAAASATDVWAVGHQASSGATTPLTEHWNGTAWSVMNAPGGFYGELNGIANIPGTNHFWAVGEYYSTSGNQTLIMRWNGTTWNQVNSPNVGSHLNSLFGITAVSDNNAWAVGSYYDGSVTTTLVEHWNGTTWSIVSSPNPSSSFNNLLSVTAVSTTDVWAVGSSTGNTASPALIEHWNGQSWSIMANPATMGELTAVANVPGTDQVWATGYGASGSTGLLFENWNGSSWSVFPGPDLGSRNNQLQSIVAVSRDDIWAVGEYSSGTYSYPTTLVEHWDGKSWATVTLPSKGSSDDLCAVTDIPGAQGLWVAGKADNQSLIESYS